MPMMNKVKKIFFLLLDSSATDSVSAPSVRNGFLAKPQME